MVTYTCKHSTCKAEEEWSEGQPELHSETTGKHAHTHAPPANAAGDKAYP